MKQLTIALLAVAMLLTACTSPAFAQKKKPAKPAQKPKIKLDADGIPDGKPEVIIEFMQRSARKLVQDPPESEKLFRKELMTILKAAEKILKSNPKEARIRIEAISAKVSMLRALGQYGDKTATAKLTKFLTGLKTDKDESIRDLAAQQLLLARASDIPTLNNKQRAALSKDVLAYIEAGTLQRRFGIGMQVAETYERFGNNDDAASLYLKLAGILKKSKDKDIASQAAMLEGFARRVMLPGSTLKVLTGKTVEGKTFDWAKYRGKVVLIDFWATWCRPCIAELPNVLRNYEQYHDKGFEVVGVSLDSRKEKLTGFIKESKIPWTNLFHDEGDARQPMADYYGVTGIPFTILVDRKGKVVATNVRGARLGRLLRGLMRDGETQRSTEKAKSDGN